MRRIKGSPEEGLLGATVGFFVGFAAVALFGPTAHKFKEVMDLSPFMVGLLVAMPSLSGSILRIPFSAWVDSTGGRKPFLVLLIASLVGMLGLFCVVFFFYPHGLHDRLYALLLVLGLLCGCGIATFSVGISQVSYWFPQRRQGYALGTYAGVGNLAPGIFSFLVPLSLVNFGLAGSYLAWLVFLAVGVALYFKMGRNACYFQLIHSGEAASNAGIVARKNGQEIFPSGNTYESIRLSARVWKTWVLVVIYFTTFGGFIALTAWFPTYWKEFFGLSAIHAGYLTGAYSILTALVRVAGGSISDGIGGEKTLLASLGVFMVGTLLMTVSVTMPLAITGVVLLALGMGAANAAVFKLVPQEVPEAVGGAAGWVGGLGALGGFVLPPLMGFFVEGLGRIGYVRGFLVFVFLSFTSLAMALLLRRGHKSGKPVRIRELDVRAARLERIFIEE